MDRANQISSIIQEERTSRRGQSVSLISKNSSKRRRMMKKKNLKLDLYLTLCFIKSENVYGVSPVEDCIPLYSRPMDLSSLSDAMTKEPLADKDQRNYLLKSNLMKSLTSLLQAITIRSLAIVSVEHYTLLATTSICEVRKWWSQSESPLSSMLELSKPGSRICQLKNLYVAQIILVCLLVEESSAEVSQKRSQLAAGSIKDIRPKTVLLLMESDCSTCRICGAVVTIQSPSVKKEQISLILFGVSTHMGNWGPIVLSLRCILLSL